MATHLYWRINCGSHGSGSTVYSIAEIAFAAASGGPNLAVGGTAIGSAQYSGSYAFAMAFDGNAGTRWASPDGAATAWIGYQFANPVDVAELRITADTDGNVGDAPLVFVIEHSDDGITYTSVKALSAAAWTLGQTQTFDVTPLPPPPQGAHWYWRVNILNCSNGLECGICEIGMAALVGGPNLLTGGVPKADRYYGVGYEAKNAVDGNLATMWISPATTPTGWWQYQLEAPAAIAELKITAGSGGNNASRTPSSWQLQYSDDGVTFTMTPEGVITSGAWSDGQTQTFEFATLTPPPATTRRRPVVIFN